MGDAASGADGRARASNLQISAAEGELMAGAIKSFSERHGYGFIESSCCPGDVRFSMSDLDSLNPGANLKGELVLFKANSQPDGKIQASKVMFQSGKIASRLKAGGGMQGGMMAGMQGGMMAGMQGGMQGGAMQFGGQGMKRGAQSMGGGFGKKQNTGAVATMSTGNHLSGMVKSFNTGKGFGFISAAGVPGDIFFMKSALPAPAQEN